MMKVDDNVQEQFDNLKQWIMSRDKKQLLAFAAVVAGAVIILNYIMPRNTEQRIESAEASVQALYEDDLQEKLNPEVNRKMIRDARRKTNRLKGEAKTELGSLVTAAEEKLKVTSELEALYQTEIMGEEAPHELPFKENIQEEDIVSRTQDVDWTLQDGVTTQLDHIKSNARSDWETLSRLSTSVNRLVEHNDFPRDQIPSMIQEVNQINQHGQRVNHHPQMNEIEAKYQTYVDGLIDNLHEAHQEEPLSQETLELLYQTDYVLNLIAGTELDARPKVSFTFDDGPNDEFTPQVLELLDEYDVPGTFFVLGRYVEIYPEVAKQIVDEGHIIANHTYNHPDLSQISDSEVLEQINVTQELIEEATGVTPTLYRMPYGAGGERVYRLVEDLTSITWNTDTSDWLLGDSDAIHDNIMEQLNDDMLILLHDTSQYSVNALEKLIISLSELNYNFVTPLELEFDYRY